jgi:DNA-directed RNA polymerase subunit omega
MLVRRASLHNTTWLAIKFKSPQIQTPMKTHNIEEATKVVPNKQQLINIVSKRLRELSAGSRPMVEVDLQMGLADIALAEIAAGKLSIESHSDATDLFKAI